jgi:hypothetical protein
LESKQVVIVGDLKDVLVSDKGIKAKASAVTAARDKLMRIENNFLELKIRATSAELSLAPDWTEAAVAFLRIRNKRLGHARSGTLSEEERVRLLQWHLPLSAPALARRLLEAYIDALERKGSI